MPQTTPQHDNLTIHNTPLTQLKPYTDNPRIGNIDTIAESLQTNGQYKPIIIRQETNEILVGNHTYKAAQQLGWTTIKTTHLTGLTDEEAARIVLADNRTSDIAEYNNYTLQTLLNTLPTLEGTGYTTNDLDALTKELLNEQTIEGNTDPDDIPNPPTPTITQPGDQWQLGPHTLVCGDATTPTTYLQLLGPNTTQLLLTDPPYNVAYTGGTKEQLTIQNDSMSDEDFNTFLYNFYLHATNTLDPGRSAYIFHADSAGNTFRNQYLKTGMELKQTLVWIKQSLVLSRQDYHWQHEPILYGWKPGAAHHWYGNRKHTTIIDTYDPERLKNTPKETLIEVIKTLFENGNTTTLRYDRPSRSLFHPTTKPVEILETLIKNSTQPGETILDPFAGSGSTLIAAHRTSRTAALIELDPVYADVICKRYETYTGETPYNITQQYEHAFTQENEEASWHDQ